MINREKIKEIGHAAKEKLGQVPLPVWGMMFGAVIGLAAQNAEASSGVTMSADLAEWAPAALVEFLAFAGGVTKSFALTRSDWYHKTIGNKNGEIRSQIQGGVETQVRNKIGAMDQSRIKLEPEETIEEYTEKQIKKNVDAQFATQKINEVNPWGQAVKEGMRMASGFGGPGLMVCDALIGLGAARLVVDGFYAINGFTWMIGIDPKERLLDDTLSY